MYLELKGISKKYKDKFAIKDITFGLEQGKLLCLLGPSGCGKSTILKAIGGFIKTDSGNILLDGTDITGQPPELRTVSTVFQSYGLFPYMNVLSNIIYGLQFKKMKKQERIELGIEMLKTIGLLGYEKKQIAELSGGEQQRVALARSLIVKPKILLLDEPLSNLDAKLKISMRKEIKSIQKEFGVTAIFVTHDQSEAFEIADKIILMNEGKIIQEGSAQEIYNKPRNEFALEFIGANNRLDDSYVRPEKICISKYNIENKNMRQGVIENIIFKGELIEIIFKTENNMLSSFVLNDGTEYKRGDTIFVSYNEEKLH